MLNPIPPLKAEAPIPKSVPGQEKAARPWLRVAGVLAVGVVAAAVVVAVVAVVVVLVAAADRAAVVECDSF